MSNILVTGGTGFIGTSVVNAFEAEGHTVVAHDLSLGNDIRDRDNVIRSVGGKDVVVHLAGLLGTSELFDQPYDAVDVNITGTLNVLEGCVQYGARFIGITMLPVFPSMYTATKIASCKIASAYHNAHGLPVTYVRAFNAFGERQLHGPGHPRKIIPAFSVEGWRNEPMVIWGDGEQVVDLIYVDEVAKVFVDALDAPGNDEIIDAGTGLGWTVNDVAKYVLSVTGSEAGVEYRPMRRGEIPTKVLASGEGWQYLRRTPRLNDAELIRTIVSYKDVA